MKRHLMALCLALAAFTSFAQGVVFEELTVEEAVAKAKTENKYVFVDVYTSWCSPCKMMDQKVFPLEEVGTYFNEHFVNLKLNAESGVEGPIFANEYGVRAYPTFIVLDGNGDLRHMFAGGVLDLSFIDKVAEAFDDQKAYGLLKKRYEAGERGKELSSAYIQALLKTSTSQAKDEIDEFYNSLSDKEKISKECAFLFKDHGPVGSEREEFFFDNRKKFKEELGQEEYDAIVLNLYELHLGLAVKTGRGMSAEELKASEEKIEKYGLTHPEKLEVFAAVLRLKSEEMTKEEFIEELNAKAPAMEELDKDRMLLIVLPAIKSLLSDEEKDQMLAMIDNDNVKGYIIRSFK